MKKVTILSLHLGCGGAEQSICSLANQLVHYYDVEILSVYRLQDSPFFYLNQQVKLRYLTDFVPNNAIFRQMIEHRKYLPALFEGIKGLVLLAKKRKAVCSAIKKCDADIIISTRADFSKKAGKYRKNNCRLFAWEHNHPHGNSAVIRKVKKSCRNADALVCVGRGVAEIYRHEFANSQCRVIHIPNFCEEVPREDQLSTITGKHLLACGRLEPEKGFEDLIKAFKLLVKMDNDFSLTIVGDGSQREKLTRLAVSEGICDKISFPGTLTKNEINQLYCSSDLFVMTSHTESFGLVLLEAMSHGVPCIAFDSAEGACELIEDGQNGFLVKNRDCEELAKMIMTFFESSEEKKLRLGKNAVQTVSNYSSVKITELWRNLLG